MINFTGRIDGAPFEGGTGEDVGVNVGSKTFIPGFEDQLHRHGGGRDPAGEGDVPDQLHQRRSSPARTPSST